jgi:hypothetical protein
LHPLLPGFRFGSQQAFCLRKAGWCHRRSGAACLLRRCASRMSP